MKKTAFSQKIVLTQLIISLRFTLKISRTNKCAGCLLINIKIGSTGTQSEVNP
jgi:hypothetical protein